MLKKGNVSGVYAVYVRSGQDGKMKELGSEGKSWCERQEECLSGSKVFEVVQTCVPYEWGEFD